MSFIMKAFIKDSIFTLALATVIYFVFQMMFYQCVVEQTSMTPNILEGQRIFVNKTAYFFGEPERGDIIVFRKPEVNNDKPLIKRVIGLPGEVVTIDRGTVYVNSTPLDEPYLKDIPVYIMAGYSIPENHYFVLGDNRNASYDSHYGWTVDGEVIIGKAWLSIWPPGKLGFAPNYAFADN
jgi:signal peptidase I